MHDEKVEVPERLMEWFNRALVAADFDLKLQDKEKGSGWKEATPLFLFNKMMRHVNLMMDPKVGHVHTIKVVNYALMIATRVAGAEVGDKVAESPPLSDIELEDIKLAEEERAKGESPVFDSVEELMDSIGETPEAKWKGQNITLVSAYSGVTRIRPGEPTIKIPLESEDDE